MSEMNKNNQLVEEAKSILEGLRHHQKKAADRDWETGPLNPH